MRQPLRIRLQHVLSLAIGAGAVAVVLLFDLIPSVASAVTRTLPPPALLGMLGALLALHGFVALRLRHTIAFLAGLTLGYSALVLVRSSLAPLAGLGPGGFARGFALLLPATLILIYAMGQGSLLAPRGFVRVGAVVALPLLWALLAERRPDAIAALLGFRFLPLPWPLALPQASLALLPALGLLFLWPSPRRSFYDFALAVSLMPCYVLLERTAARGAVAPAAHGASGTQAGTASLSAAIPVTYALMFGVLLYGLYRLFWQQAFLDRLTGLSNRRSFDDALASLPRRFALAMIDIDHFKAINDTYGHPEGDNVLRWVAAQVDRAFGSGAYRYGGEEFAVILPEADPEAARRRLEALRRGLAESLFCLRSPRERRRVPRRGADRRGAGGGRARAGAAPGQGAPHGPYAPPRGAKGIRVTVSIGVAAPPAPPARAEKPGEVLQRADQALYRAKRGGRNRVVLAGKDGKPGRR